MDRRMFPGFQYTFNASCLRSILDVDQTSVGVLRSPSEKLMGYYCIVADRLMLVAEIGIADIFRETSLVSKTN